MNCEMLFHVHATSDVMSHDAWGNYCVSTASKMVERLCKKLLVIMNQAVFSSGFVLNVSLMTYCNTQDLHSLHHTCWL